MKKHENCVQLVFTRKKSRPELHSMAYNLEDDIIEIPYGENEEFKTADSAARMLLREYIARIFVTHEVQLIVWEGNKGRVRRFCPWEDKRLKYDFEYETVRQII